MITITKHITLNPGVGETGPYNYTWGVTSSSSGCVTFSPSTTGTIANPSSGSIITDINFLNGTCIDDSTITLTISYNGGTCSKVFPITIADPCDDLDVAISATTTDAYLFTAVASGGEGPYTYTWGWDEDLFTPAGSSGNSQVLKLTYIGGSVPPAQSTVFLTVADQNGCSFTTSQDFATCSLSFDPVSVILECQPDGSRSAVVCLDPLGCATSLVDWTTFQSNSALMDVTLLPPTLFGQNFACYVNGGRRARITMDADTNPGNSGYNTFYCYVQTTTGVTASIQVTATYPSCTIPPVNPISIAAQAPFQIDCSYTPGSTYEIGPITDFITTYNGGQIDFTSFQFIPLDTGIPTAGPVTTTLSGSADYNNATKMIEYTVPAATGTDAFMWTICDTAGNCAESQIYAIVLDCTLSPTAVNDSECAVCGEAIEHDVLSNDTVNGVLYNVSIASSPSHGSAVFNGDFGTPRIIYTPNATYSGSDSYDYTVWNDSGESDTATVTVNVLCAGADSEIATCE